MTPGWTWEVVCVGVEVGIEEVIDTGTGVCRGAEENLLAWRETENNYRVAMACGGDWAWTASMWVDIFSVGLVRVDVLVNAEMVVLVDVGDAALVVDSAYTVVGALGSDGVDMGVGRLGKGVDGSVGAARGNVTYGDGVTEVFWLTRGWMLLSVWRTWVSVPARAAVPGRLTNHCCYCPCRSLAHPHRAYKCGGDGLTHGGCAGVGSDGVPRGNLCDEPHHRAT